ncbi:aldose 1-epimerase [Paenibacillus hexagrammi]|uniref:Aldose 1-epimerase n=1 Tax=Paenibacillus hexagrammi TaxID=2908839 RepID=A0ABY3SDU6_9BACL|nr:aldose 1-epimerase [Paenibacillus sp. YPD9-1]UJF31285.1 aldose 1-epimerase [Paenibacillus sp. YPD9-1]
MLNRYELQESIWDGETTYRLVDREAGAEAEIVPAVGLHLFRFDVRGEAYIAQPASLAELRAQSSRYGVPILCPPGRVKQAAFTFEGREYRLPPNREPHHAHGELRERPWKVTAAGADDVGGAYLSAELDVAEHPDMLAYFQHEASFRFTYRLKDGTLSLSGDVVNRSAVAMPLSLGFHPYFAYAKGEAARVRVKIPAAAQWPLTDDGYAAGLPEPSPLCAALRQGAAVQELPEYPGGSQMLTMESGAQVCEIHYEARGTKLLFDRGDRFPIHVLFTAPWTEAVPLSPTQA